MVVGAGKEKDGDRLAQIRARTSSMAKEILDSCKEMCSLHQNEFKFLNRFREDLTLCNAANLKDIADCLQREERARLVADERIEKATDAAILSLQARMTEDFALQSVNLSKVEPAATVCGDDDFVKIIAAAQQGSRTSCHSVSGHIVTTERINELEAQMQARLTSEMNLREDTKECIKRLEQEEEARVSSTNELDHKQVLQQSCCDEFAAKVETMEVLFTLQQQERGDREHHSSDVDHQLLTKLQSDFHLLQQQVQEMQNNEKNQCSHQFLGDIVMEQIQKQTNELSLLHSRLDQLDVKVISVKNNTTNMEHAKEILIQELGDMKHGLERCVIETTECQGAFRELRTRMDVENCIAAGSTMRPQRTSLSKLEPDASSRSVDDPSQTRDVACHGLRAACDAVYEQLMTINEQINELGAQVQARLLNETSLREEMKDVISLVDQEEKVRVRNTNEFEHKQVLQQSRCDDLAAKVESLAALFSIHQEERGDGKHLEDFQPLEHQVYEVQNTKIEQCLHHRLLEDVVMDPTTMSVVTACTTPSAATYSVTTSMTTQDFGAAATSCTTPVSALIRPPPIQTSSADQISAVELIDKDPKLNNCVASARAVIELNAAFRNSSVTTPSRSSKSTLKVVGLEPVTSSIVLPSVMHDMQACEDTTIVVTGSATPSTASPTSRTPRGFSAVSSASISPISSAVPTFLATTAIQTSADQISVLKLIDDNPELHNLVATQGIAQ